MHHERKLSSTEIFRGRVFRVTEDQVLLENNKQASREVVHHNGGVCVAALDKDDNLLFVRQFRYALGEEVLELPAGKREKGEDPELCGIRELEEETTFVQREHMISYRIHPTSFVNVRNEVSLMHICIPVLMQVRNFEEIRIRETEKLAGVWLLKDS